MKHVLLILDGASDLPLEELGNRTPLEASATPHLDRLAARGRLGRLRTAHPGLPVDSLVCIMGLLGYDPTAYPCGRAAYEALGQGIALGEGDLALRCNSAAVDGPGGRLTEFAASMTPEDQARLWGHAASLLPPGWELHKGQAYRGTLVMRGVMRGVVRGAGLAEPEFLCFPPHMHVGDHARDRTPRSADSAATPPEIPGDGASLAGSLARFMLGSYIPARGAEPEGASRSNGGHMLWLWGPGRKPELPSFREKYGLRGTVAAGLDFMAGLAAAAGMTRLSPSGATGGPDSNFAGKARATLESLDSHDFALVHANAPDEAGHARDSAAKIAALERIDAELLAPLLAGLAERFSEGSGGGFTLAICADHATRCLDGRHAEDPVPCLVYRDGYEGEKPGNSIRFTEACAGGAPVLASLDFLPRLLADPGGLFLPDRAAH